MRLHQTPITLSAIVTCLFTSLNRCAARFPQAGCFFFPRGTQCFGDFLWARQQEFLQHLACGIFALVGQS